MKFIWTFLAISAACGFGFHVGREYQRIKAKKQADEIHASIKWFVDASGKLRAAIGAVKKAAPVADTKATEPLRFKRGDADRALKAGTLAIGRDFGGRDN